LIFPFTQNGKRGSRFQEPFVPLRIILEREIDMSRNQEGHGIVTDDKGQEQPADKDRAQTSNNTERGKMPPQKVKQDK
jgi:hypothetical protein